MNMQVWINSPFGHFVVFQKYEPSGRATPPPFYQKEKP
jgi:hypothetical protein